MDKCPTDSLLSVVIRPTGTISPMTLKSDVLGRYPTRAEQHREVVAALIKASNEIQPQILDALKSRDFGSGAQNPRGYWIDNVITAEMSPSAITLLSSRADIKSIQLVPDATLVTPLSAGSAGAQDPSTTPNHIRAIKADSVWEAGYTGKGRLVGSIDTGVEGKHSMLSAKWRGHNGASLDESWYDPIYNDTVPRTFSGSGASHGTQVMGLMVAVFGDVDTLGACPDCEWISAAAIDIPCPSNPNAPCGNLFDALQWIADPDGDPNTDWDVPDAVANPWGALSRNPQEGCQLTGVGCSDVFWNAIDNIETAGTLMIFAAGNEGQCGSMSIRNPANRASSETNSFSVGMVDTRNNVLTPPVDPLSSRGPSDCDGVSVKPELVAPGVQLKTTTPANGVQISAYGTSFSSPLVAAGAALLREYNPNATVDQIKMALLAGAKDLGAAGPDDNYGHGLLDLMSALRSLPAGTEPAIYVKRDDYVPPAPGTSTELVLTLRNCGAPATGITVDLSSAESRLSIVDGNATFTDLAAYGDSTDNAGDPFEIEVSAACLPGERLPLEIVISADGGYSRSIGGAISVGPDEGLELYTHDAGNFVMTVSAAGSFGHQIDGIDPRPGGAGYLYASDPTKSLFEGALILATDASHVSSRARTESGTPGVDFLVHPGGLITVQEPGTFGAEETRSGFDDSQADNPIGVYVEQRTIVSDDPEHADYLIVEYSISNRTDQVIEDLYCGLYFDWDFPWYTTRTDTTATKDGGGFDTDLEVGWMRHRYQDRFRGLAVVSGTPHL